MKKYRKKTKSEVPALQLTADTYNKVCSFVRAGTLNNNEPEKITFLNGKIGLLIPSADGLECAIEGDWIVKGNFGFLYIYKPDAFKELFELVI